MRGKKKSGIIGMVLLCSCLIGGLSGCSGSTEEISGDAIVLRIANWEEYIDEGEWDESEEICLENGQKILGENSMVEDFEQWYADTYHKKVKVEYSAFGTNEDMYNQLTIGDVYDLICPSEYMIMKLMAEDKLLKFSNDFYDTKKKTNYYVNGVSPYIKSTLDELEFEGEAVGDYAAGYMWGTLGYLYNPEYVSEEDATDWGLLLNKKYRKRVTAKDSVRDCYFAVRGMCTQDQVSAEQFKNSLSYHDELSSLLNDTSDESIRETGEILSEVKDNVYSFETDSGKADIVSGKVVANLQWSGDAVYSMQQVEEDGIELLYAVPEASTNMWFDGWCMLKKGIGKDREKQQAAEAFINFVSRPDNVVRNMYYIGYTSTIAGGDDQTVYDYVKDMYGAEEEEGTTDYDLNYFFRNAGQSDASIDYTIKAEPLVAKGQLYAQYPTEDVIKRSVVMAYFGNKVNEKISRMWIDMRCFDGF